MGFILQMVALAGAVIAILGIALVVSASSRRENTRGGVLITVIGVVIGLVFFVLSQGLLIVPVTERAVIFNALTGTLETPRGPGISIIIPGIQQPYMYPINNQTFFMTDDVADGRRVGQAAIQARSIEGQEVRVNAVLTYRLDSSAEGLNRIHRDWFNQIGGYELGLVRPSLNNVVQEITATYTAENIYGRAREEMGRRISERLTETLGRQGIEVVAFRILELTFTPEFTEAIERKEIANQELQRAQTEAQRVETEARGRAQAAIEQARGQAESALLAARAEAEALSLISQQIAENPALIQFRYVENLSDNVQLILVPTNSPFLFDFQSLAASAVPQPRSALPPAGE
jgi:regulator of protease activity HflC (stomatin/prohibitin superfamily)